MFKKGDWIRGTNDSNGMYGVTNEDMYLGYVESKTDDGYIEILVTVHKNPDRIGTRWRVLNNGRYFNLVSNNYQVATAKELEHFLLETEGYYDRHI